MLQPEKKKKNSTSRHYRWLALLIMILIVLAAGALMLIPKMFARPMQLVYSARNRLMEPSDSGEDWFLYLINADGSGDARQMGMWASSGDAWSPDGTRLAFNAYQGNKFSSVFVMNADGSHPVNLTESLDPETQYNVPVWSPDGAKIAFTGTTSLGAGEIWIVNADGSSPVRVYDRHAAQPYPAWSPDGKRIAFVGEKRDIFLMDVASLNLVQLTRSQDINTRPAWSPDGRLILFERSGDGNGGQNEIFVVNADGTNEINLSNHAARDESPVWSPDGRRVVFSSLRDGYFEIYGVDADGTHLSRLTMTNGNSGFPSFSPDGSKIAYQTAQDLGGTRFIAIMDADGSHQTTLVEGSHPHWRPNPCGAWDIVCYLTRS